jgi:polysaccharide export outer membrane protein
MKKIIILFLTAYIIFCPGLNLTRAQQQEENKAASRNAGLDYYLAPGTDNQLLIKVNIWGEVLKPGIVEVPDNTDLLTLISMAGGPTENAKLSKVKIKRNFNQNKVLTVNVKDYVQNGKSEEIPMVKPGDTVIIPRNSFHSVSKYITFLYNLAVIASVVKLITD